VFFWGVGELFAAQHRERAAQPPAGAARQDDVVDEAAARRGKGVGKFLTVFLDRGLVAEIGAKDDFDRTLRTHHRDLGGRPIVIGAGIGGLVTAGALANH